MPYAQTTLGSFVSYISGVLDDPTNKYWTVPEITSVTWEALRLWGALTNYWRTRQVFNVTPDNTFYNLAEVMPTLRTRTWILNQMVQEIQSMLLENPSGIAGTGMSGQVTIDNILQSIQNARNRFVLDVKFPLSYKPQLAKAGPSQGMFGFPQESIYVHRVSWQDSTSQIWTNLWREDAWAVDHNNPQWTVEPGQPTQFSESEQSPLLLQISPPPINEGTLDALTVDSLNMDLTNGFSTFDVPDEWVHAIKYAALSSILSGGQITNQFLCDYCEQRYRQYVELARDARSVLRLMCNNYPLTIDSLAALDGNVFWRNQSGPPRVAGVLYDMLAFYPGNLDNTYSIAADVVQSAPLPLSAGEFLQVGYEDVEHLASYVEHILQFKCGGNDFRDTMSNYDDFMKAVASRKAINLAKIKNFEAMFGQPQKEWAERPDSIEVVNA